jgi:hypothetical protein
MQGQKRPADVHGEQLKQRLKKLRPWILSVQQQLQGIPLEAASAQMSASQNQTVVVCKNEFAHHSL